MKTLYLLRHAEAASDKGEGDFERSLTARGREDAAVLGRVMLEKGYVPQVVKCSSARRTKQTLEGVMESVKINSVHHDKAIYHAMVQELFEMVRGIDDGFESALIVGHNPTIHELAAGLAAEDGSLTSELARGYAPGTLAVFSCARVNWKDLQAGENKLMDLLHPDR